MIDLIRKKILSLLGIKEIKENQDKILINQGKILNKINETKNFDKIHEYEFKVFSQFGEDGIIQYLINNLDIKNKIFVEFGVENYKEANTRFLLENNNWKGLIIDSSEKNISFIKKQNYYWKFNLLAICSFINCENINKLFEENNFSGNIGLLSIDIDGNDYWVWKSINTIDPDVVVIEYNSRFGNNKSFTIPYDPKFIRGKNNHLLYFGASLKALSKLGKSKGYELICTNSNGNNAFFVKQELVNEKIRPGKTTLIFNEKTFNETDDDQDFNFDKYPLEEV